jgi:hypothetical protein
VQAYQRDEIKNFEQILKQNQQKIMEDTFIRNYIQDLLKNIRTQVLVKTIKPYTRIKIPSIAAELNIPEADVEALLVSLILDRKIQGLDARLHRFAPHLLDERHMLLSLAVPRSSPDFLTVCCENCFAKSLKGNV